MGRCPSVTRRLRGACTIRALNGPDKPAAESGHIDRPGLLSIAMVAINEASEDFLPALILSRSRLSGPRTKTLLRELDHERQHHSVHHPDPALDRRLARLPPLAQLGLRPLGHHRRGTGCPAGARAPGHDLATASYVAPPRAV